MIGNRERGGRGRFLTAECAECTEGELGGSACAEASEGGVSGGRGRWSGRKERG